MQLVCDFGQVLQWVVWSRLSEHDTLEDAFHSFLSYYRQNEMFDLYTHGTGPGMVGVVVHSLKTYLGRFIETKLDKDIPVAANRKCSLDIYMNKLRDICAKVVCDPEEQGSDERGRLKKVVEEAGKATRGKKNVKHTERKVTATTSKTMEKAMVSSEEDVGDESCSSGEEHFSTLTSFGSHEQYKPPDKPRERPNLVQGDEMQQSKTPFRLQCRMSSEKWQTNLVNKRRSLRIWRCLMQPRRRNWLNLGEMDQAWYPRQRRKPFQNGEDSRGNTLKNYEEWALTERGFQPAEQSTLKGQYLKSNHNTFLQMYWHQYESGYGDQWWCTTASSHSPQSNLDLNLDISSF